MRTEPLKIGEEDSKAKSSPSEESIMQESNPSVEDSKYVKALKKLLLKFEGVFAKTKYPERISEAGVEHAIDLL